MNWSKRQRIVISVIAFFLFSILSSLKAMNHNSRSYQEHPIAALLGAAAPNIIVAFGFYWLFGIQRKQPKWSIPFLKSKSVDNGKKDDWAFEQAAGELDSGSIEKSIWARAFAECKGDEAASKARYITLRVERLVSQRVLDAQRTIDAQPEPEESIGLAPFPRTV